MYPCCQRRNQLRLDSLELYWISSTLQRAGGQRLPDLGLPFEWIPWTRAGHKPRDLWMGKNHLWSNFSDVRENWSQRNQRVSRLLILARKEQALQPWNKDSHNYPLELRQILGRWTRPCRRLPWSKDQPSQHDGRNQKNVVRVKLKTSFDRKLMFCCKSSIQYIYDVTLLKPKGEVAPIQRILNTRFTANPICINFNHNHCILVLVFWILNARQFGWNFTNTKSRTN